MFGQKHSMLLLSALSCKQLRTIRCTLACATKAQADLMAPTGFHLASRYVLGSSYFVLGRISVCYANPLWTPCIHVDQGSSPLIVRYLVAAIVLIPLTKLIVCLASTNGKHVATKIRHIMPRSTKHDRGYCMCSRRQAQRGKYRICTNLRPLPVSAC